MSRSTGLEISPATTAEVIAKAIEAVMSEQELKAAALIFAIDRLPAPYKAQADRDAAEFIEATKLLFATSLLSEPLLTNA